LCGLAITEAERGLPDVNRRVRAMLLRAGVPADDDLVLRMTGCPNGCARPYMAELGFVGDGPNTYQLWIGGNLGQTRLATLFAERVRLRDLEAALEPLFAMWQQQRGEGGKERFGDFVDRVGFAAVRAFAAGYKPAAKGATGGGSNGNGNGAAAASSSAAQQGAPVSR